MSELIRPGVLEGWEEWSAYCLQIEARLADKKKLLADAVKYGTDYKQSYDEAMANYQAVLARLAEALAEMDNHHSDYCDQVRGPIGEQWRDYDKPCTCWVGDVKRTASSAEGGPK